MVSIGEDDLRAEFFQRLLREPLHVAAVPTGINAGVSITPCGVVRRPRRAPVGSVFRTSNGIPSGELYQERNSIRKCADPSDLDENPKAPRRQLQSSALFQS